MRKIIFSIIVVVFIAVYTVINLYVGLRLGAFVNTLLPFLEPVLYWMFFWIVVYTYIISRVFNQLFPSITIRRAKIVGAYWLALLFYFLISFIIIDLAILVTRIFKPNFSLWDNEVFLLWFGILFLTFMSLLIVRGYKNASQIEINRYNVNISKSLSKYDKINIVVISDLHLGTIVDNNMLQKFVDEINGLEPDIITILGDVVDEDVRPFIQQKMEKTFAKLSAKIGIYAVLGNHDYFGGGHAKIIDSLQRANIKVLVDEHVNIMDGLIIAGRIDPTGARYCGHAQKPLKSWMNDINFDNPVILLTHQPTKLEEARKIGVDLQLSGHTHRGQLFPNNFFTSLFFENHWGLRKKGEFTSIVTSGAGTWGPPIRTGHKAEIVQITLNLEDKGES
ncbi:metallophosphoesterase [Proteinivorax tanatarense]|uniref:Metallophosphoesterase n=1 Tax=Proteinivorax tanatarense TaxID=1260629 RepID=A0AAU7VJ58_9FIRM